MGVLQSIQKEKEPSEDAVPEKGSGQWIFKRKEGLMAEKETLVEKHIFRENHPYYAELDRLTFLSKNLYNATLYAVRQHFFSTGEYPGYQAVNREFTHSDNPDYRALPAKVAKHTQMLVDYAMKSFFALNRMFKDGKQKNKPRPPRYLDPATGRQAVHYEKGAVSRRELKDGIVHLSRTGIRIKTKVPANRVQFARIVPHGGYITVEIGYKRDLPECRKPAGRYAAIDLGLNNLAMVSSNVMEPFIIDGRKVKYINNRYNREIAKRRMQLAYYNKKKTSRRIQEIALRRNNRVSDFMHKASSMLVNHLVSNGIDTLVIGYSEGWKQDADMGKIGNQRFVQIPFLQFVSNLEYKCRQQGIRVIRNEESYTSKCSFFDDETIEKHLDGYCGKRVRRGLFRTAEGRYINADLNGSLNIMKKALIKAGEWTGDLWLQCMSKNSSPAIVRYKVALS